MSATAPRRWAAPHFRLTLQVLFVHRRLDLRIVGYQKADAAAGALELSYNVRFSDGIYIQDLPHLLYIPAAPEDHQL